MTSFDAGVIEGMEKVARLPSYLRRMTRIEGGISNIKRWPKDRRLEHVMEQWQAGRINQPHFRGPHADSFRDMVSKIPPKGSMSDIWRQSKKSLRGQ
jgi:hypothetical protein